MAWPYDENFMGGSVAEDEQFTPYTIEPQTEAFLRQQAQLSNSDPNMAIDEYVSKMNNLRRREVEGNILGKYSQNIEAGLEVSPAMRMIGAYKEAIPQSFEEAVAPKPANTIQGGPPSSMIKGGPIAPPPEVDQNALAAVQMSAWDEETAGRQHDYDTIAYINRIQSMSPGSQLGDVVGAAATPGLEPTLTSKKGAGRIGIQETPSDPAEEQKIREAGGLSPESRAYKAGGRDGRKAITGGGGVGDAAWRAKQRGQKGTFSASRQLPSQNVDFAHVQDTESPAIQRLWQEQRMKTLGIDRVEAATKLEAARADLLTAQARDANLPPEERLKRHFERLFEVQGMMRDWLLPDVDQTVSDQMAVLMTQDDAEATIGAPGSALRKATEARLKTLEMDKAFKDFRSMMASMMMLQDPAGASRFATEEQSTAIFGAPPTTP